MNFRVSVLKLEHPGISALGPVALLLQNAHLIFKPLPNGFSARIVCTAGSHFLPAVATVFLVGVQIQSLSLPL